MKRDLKSTARPAVERALKALATGLRAARLARRMPIAELAARSGCSPATVKRIESGDPSVAMGSWMACFVVVGLAEQLARAASESADRVGEALRDEQLRKRGQRSTAGDDSDYDF